jgi:hypothetical protein
MVPAIPGTIFAVVTLLLFQLAAAIAGGNDEDKMRLKYYHYIPTLGLYCTASAT